MSVTLPVLGSGAVDDESDDGAGGVVRRNRSLIVVAVLAVLVVAVATWIVAFSPMFGANTVTVHGTKKLTVAQVHDAAAIKHGTPLVRLDTAAVARRVESLPLVASATVRTDYPSTVVITITERVAVGYLTLGKKYLLVDKTGAQYRTVQTEPRLLPLFVVPAGPNAQATGQAVATVAASLTPALLATIASVQAFDPTAITLLLNDHRVVRWGSDERSADKARILPVLLRQPGTTFDLTNPDQVVTH
ncbi:MAG: cell division protein FtsQ [Pseudonocardiales bacterium]|nr:cell division protein FtsQ [Pseudonocardiales bacterium]